MKFADKFTTSTIFISLKHISVDEVTVVSFTQTYHHSVLKPMKHTTAHNANIHIADIR